MGLVSTMSNGFIKICFLVVLTIFFPGLPPTNVHFESFTITPTLNLTGALSLNDKLNNAERLFENEIKGPEAMLVYNNELYTGLYGGHVVKIVNDKLVPIVKFGEKCDGFYEEMKCGRPLGLFADKGALYVSDAYYGIYKHNLSSGVSERLVAGDDTIEGKPVKILNSIAVAEDSTVYYTVSSTSHKLQDGLYTFLANGNGRLLKYNPVSKSNELLMDNLYFANGIVLSDDESYLLVAETALSRIMRYYLKGSKKGSSDVFIDGLPGLPDNLQKDGKNGYIIPLVEPVGDDNPFLIHKLADKPLIRKFLARLMALLEYPLEKMDKYYPNYYCKLAVHWIGHFESFGALSKKSRVTIVFVNKDGKITKSLHATDRRISDICDFTEWNGYYYLGSPFNHYLARVKAS